MKCFLGVSAFFVMAAVACAQEQGALQTLSKDVKATVYVTVPHGPGAVADVQWAITHRGFKVPAGTYKPLKVRFYMRSKSGRQWQVIAFGAENPETLGKIEVKPRRATVIKAGPPLIIESNISEVPGEPNSVYVSYFLKDIYGNTYYSLFWGPQDELPEALFRLVTEEGKVVAAGKLAQEKSGKKYYYRRKVVLPPGFSAKCCAELKLDLGTMPHAYKFDCQHVGRAKPEDDKPEPDAPKHDDPG